MHIYIHNIWTYIYMYIMCIYIYSMYIIYIMYIYIYIVCIYIYTYYYIIVVSIPMISHLILVVPFLRWSAVVQEPGESMTINLTFEDVAFVVGKMDGLNVQGGAPKIAKLVNITLITMTNYGL